jgi:hypothetical protein
MHTLSFVILDDLRQSYGPVHFEIKDAERQTIRETIEQIAHPFLKYIRRTEKLSFEEIYCNEVLEDEETDPTGWFLNNILILMK